MPALVKSELNRLEIRIDLIGAEARNTVILNASTRP